MIDTKKLVRELTSLTEGQIVLIETTAEKLLEVNLTIVQYFCEKNYSQIILSTSRPCKHLLNSYAENGIDVTKLIVLCTQCQGKEKNEQDKNVIHLSSSSSLTEISLSLSKCMESIKDKKFIFIDSIDTMLIHNDAGILAKFIHFILTKMRINNVSGLLISLQKETNRGIRAEIAQLCDKILEV